MAAPSSSRLLKLALPLVKTHGFTREALSRSVLALPPSSEAQLREPLSDSAITSLFGKGDIARRTLVDAWLEEGLVHMSSGALPSAQQIEVVNASGSTEKRPSVRDVLRARLEYNEPVLPHLPDAFALMASSGFHVVDPLPAMKHTGRVADMACTVAGERSLQLEWYTKRASIAAVYAAAELHQLTSPHTAYTFLDSLLASSSDLRNALSEVGLYSEYVFKSWKGIIKSSGILPPL